MQSAGTRLVRDRSHIGANRVAVWPRDVADAISEAAQLLHAAQRPLVYIYDGALVRIAAHGDGIADVLGAALDSITTSTVGDGMFAAQRRGPRRCDARRDPETGRKHHCVLGRGPGHAICRFTSAGSATDRPLRPAWTGGPAGNCGDVGEDRGPSDANGRVTSRPTKR